MDVFIGISFDIRLRKTSVTYMLFLQRKQGIVRKKYTESSRGCFGYGQEGRWFGHSTNRKENREPGLFLRCRSVNQPQIIYREHQSRRLAKCRGQKLDNS